MEHIAQAPTTNPPDVSKKTSPGKRGRPPGSKNRRRRAVELSPALRVVQETSTRFLQVIGEHVKGISFVSDGAFGNHDALHMVKQTGWHVIATLRHDSALSFPDDGPYAGCGKRRKYGTKLNDQHLPAAYWPSSSLEDGMQTTISQMKVWQKTCADVLNGVVMVKTKVKTQAMAHVVLCSRDLELRHDQLIDYDHVRFQMAGNCRDAKQYWGLEDCMTVNQTPVDHSANLAMFMVHLSHALLRPIRTQWPECSVHDLKAWFRGRKSVVETLQWLPEMPEPIFIDQAMAQVAALGRVNHAINSV